MDTLLHKIHKYHDKYKSLLVQKGGGNVKILCDDGREYLVNSENLINIEMKINKSKYMHDLKHIGDVLYAKNLRKHIIGDPDTGIQISKTDFDKFEEIVTDQIKKISETTQEDIPDRYEIVPYINILSKEYPVLKKIDSLDYLVNLLNLRKEYLTIHEPWEKARLKEIKEWLVQHKLDGNYIQIYNHEKNSDKSKYDNLKILFSGCDTYYVSKLVIDTNYVKEKGITKNIGTLVIDDKMYLYKEYTSYVPHVLSLHDCYKYINNCNEIEKQIYNNPIKYNTNNGFKYNIKFVKVPKICVFSREQDMVRIGFVMEIIKGDTINHIRTNNQSYWERNKNMIKTAIIHMITQLTELNFLIYDFSYSNVMWDVDTNTLTYIDVNKLSFDKPNADINRNIINEVLRDSIN